MLLGFQFEGMEFSVTKAPNFYDYLYIRGLLSFPNRSLLKNYDGFTDIAFSQTSLEYKSKRSYNCQARSVAIFLTISSKYKEIDILNNLKQLMTRKTSEVIQLDLF